MVFLNVAVLIILVFSIMSVISLWKIKKQSHLSFDFGNERYYELKYKIQYITSVGIVVIGVGAFFGYDKYEKFVERFDKKADSLEIKIKTYDAIISEMDKNLKTYDNKIYAYDSFIKRLEKSSNIVWSDLKNSNQSLLQLKDTIENIKKRNILEKSFYIVSGLKKSMNIWSGERYYFKDLTTIIGDKLPPFDKNPFIIIVPEDGVDYKIVKVTKDYIDIGIGGVTEFDSNEKDKKTSTFGLLISKKQ